MKTILFVVWFLVLGSVADAALCTSRSLGPGDYTRYFWVGYSLRSYKLHVPVGHDKLTPLALVLNFHGGGGNADGQIKMSGMNAAADKYRFAVAYPNGSSGFLGWFLTFNAGLCCDNAKKNNVDDVKFTALMLDHIQASVCVDEKRVYSTGFSNGALMSYRLACELSDRIRAIAPVGATLGIDQCRPVRPVPLLHIHGTADEFAPYGGGIGKVGNYDFRGVAETVEIWRALNDANVGPKVMLQQGAVKCDRWDGKAPVVLCTVKDGGHTWPGGHDGATTTPFGAVNRDIDANDLIWQFFKEA
jgi:polyhydroxybutyrate depolymerase